MPPSAVGNVDLDRGIVVLETNACSKVEVHSRSSSGSRRLLVVAMLFEYCVVCCEPLLWGDSNLSKGLEEQLQ